MARAELLSLVNKIYALSGQILPHQLFLKTCNYHTSAETGLPDHPDDLLHHRHAAHAVQYLGQSGLHAGTLPRRQNKGCQICHFSSCCYYLKEIYIRMSFSYVSKTRSFYFSK